MIYRDLKMSCALQCMFCWTFFCCGCCCCCYFAPLSVSGFECVCVCVSAFAANVSIFLYKLIHLYCPMQSVAVISVFFHNAAVGLALFLHHVFTLVGICQVTDRHKFICRCRTSPMRHRAAGTPPLFPLSARTASCAGSSHSCHDIVLIKLIVTCLHCHIH